MYKGMTCRKNLLLAFVLLSALFWSDLAWADGRIGSRLGIDARPVQEKLESSTGKNSSGRVLIHRLAGPVTLDGRVEEDAWMGAASLAMVMQMPEFGGPPSENTEVLIGFDDQYLYVGARLFDQRAGQNPVSLEET